MASKKKSLSDSAEAMTAALFGTSEKQEPEETKKAKTKTVFPESSAARTLNLEIEDATVPARTLNLEIERTTFPDKKQAKAQKTEAKKSEKVTYGARISKDTITAWKAYIDASGKDAGACAEQALKDYMNNHKLTGIAKQIYDLKMQNVNK